MRVTNASKRWAALTLIALFVLSAAPRAHAYRHHHPKQTKQAGLANARLTAAVNIDADQDQDLVTLESNGRNKTLKIRFGNAKRSRLAFTSGTDEVGGLIVGDIDRDGDVDLVWVGSANSKSAVVLINNGEGDFAAADDNSPYASELDDLFSSNDSSNQNRLRRGRKSSSLISTSFHEDALPVVVRFQGTISSILPLAVLRPLRTPSAFACYLRKRGPPSILS